MNNSWKSSKSVMKIILDEDDKELADAVKENSRKSAIILLHMNRGKKLYSCSRRISLLTMTGRAFMSFIAELNTSQK